MSDLAPAMAIVGFSMVIAWIVRTVMVNRRQTRIAQLKCEIQGKLVDRFGSSPELMSFLESERGREFLQSTTTEEVSFHRKILGSVQSGIILTLVGIALLVLSQSRPIDWQEFYFLGLVVTALGIGYLAAAGAAYNLSKRWGLLRRSGEE